MNQQLIDELEKTAAALEQLATEQKSPDTEKTAGDAGSAFINAMASALGVSNGEQ